MPSPIPSRKLIIKEKRLRCENPSVGSSPKSDDHKHSFHFKTDCKNNYIVAKNEALDLMLKSIAKCAEAEFFKQGFLKYKTDSEHCFNSKFFDDNAIKNIIGLKEDSTHWTVDSSFFKKLINDSMKRKGFTVDIASDINKFSVKLSRAEL